MKRHGDRGSLKSVPARQRGHRRAAGRSIRLNAPGDQGGAADGAALALLSEVLIGDSPWTMGEVRGLIWLRELAERGRWSADGLDD